MEQSHWSRTAVSGILGLVAAILVSFTFPVAKNLPCGLVLPEKVVRAPSDPKSITSYPDTPLTGEPMGYVNLLMRIDDDPTPADEAKILNKANELAATVGANGIVKQYDTAVQTGPFHALLFRGLAIYVPKGGL